MADLKCHVCRQVFGAGELIIAGKLNRLTVFVHRRCEADM